MFVKTKLQVVLVIAAVSLVLSACDLVLGSNGNDDVDAPPRIESAPTLELSGVVEDWHESYGDMLQAKIPIFSEEEPTTVSWLMVAEGDIEPDGSFDIELPSLREHLADDLSNWSEYKTSRYRLDDGAEWDDPLTTTDSAVRLQEVRYLFVLDPQNTNGPYDVGRVLSIEDNESYGKGYSTEWVYSDRHARITGSIKAEFLQDEPSVVLFKQIDMNLGPGWNVVVEEQEGKLEDGQLVISVTRTTRSEPAGMQWVWYD